MVVAPELFDEHHALYALQLADRVLRGPLGMKTLDPSDVHYRPTWDKWNDSNDPLMVNGISLHNVGVFACALHRITYSLQGPEWGWLLGYFLRAYLYFDIRVGEGKTVSY